MSVVPLTLTISLCLVFTFVIFFLREHSRRRFSGAESETLLPLGEETPRLAGRASGCASSAQADEHAHAHAEACRGNNTCSSCERRAERRARRAAEAAASQQA